MPDESPTRQRMIAATARLLQRQGMAATGLNEILQAAEAPRGSLYHHFPGGKNQLAADAIRYSGARVARAIEAAMGGAPSLESAIAAFGKFYETSLSASGFRDGCPVAATALEAAGLGAPEVQAACADAFASWEAPIARRLEAEGYSAGEAAELATLVLASLEGGLLLAQARRDMAPLHSVIDQLIRMLAPGADIARAR